MVFQAWCQEIEAQSTYKESGTLTYLGQFDSCQHCHGQHCASTQRNS